MEAEWMAPTVSISTSFFSSYHGALRHCSFWALVLSRISAFCIRCTVLPVANTSEPFPFVIIRRCQNQYFYFVKFLSYVFHEFLGWLLISRQQLLLFKEGCIKNLFGMWTNPHFAKQICARQAERKALIFVSSSCSMNSISAWFSRAIHIEVK